MKTETGIIAALTVALIIVLVAYSKTIKCNTAVGTFSILGFVRANNYGAIAYGVAPAGTTVPQLWFARCNSGDVTNTKFRLRLEYKSKVSISDVELPFYFSGCTYPQLLFYFEKPLTGNLILQRMDVGVSDQYYNVSSKTVNNITEIQYEGTETTLSST
jgi:hypothetical protein